jgi:hypothetical protein
LLSGFSPCMQGLERFSKGGRFSADNLGPSSDPAQDARLVLLVHLPLPVIPNESLEGQAWVL